MIYTCKRVCHFTNFRSKSKLQKWIKKYNGHEELKSSETWGHIIMIKGYRRIRDELERYHEMVVNDKRVLRLCLQRELAHRCNRIPNGKRFPSKEAIVEMIENYNKHKLPVELPADRKNFIFF